MLFVFTFAVSAVLCAVSAFLPVRLWHRAFAPRDAACALCPLALTWLTALFIYDKPGLLTAFTPFRCGAVLALCCLYAAAVAGFRCLRGTKIPWLRPAALVLLATGAEVLLFNAPYFASHDYTPLDLTPYMTEGSSAYVAEGAVHIDADHDALAFAGMDVPLYNVTLQGLAYGGAAADPLCTIRVDAADDATSAAFEAGRWDVAVHAPASASRFLDLSGAVHSLTLTFRGYSNANVDYPLHYTLSAVVANVPRAFHFTLRRWFGLCLMLWLVAAFLPDSRLWHTPVLAAGRFGRAVRLGCLALLMALALAAPFAAPAFSGVATPRYNTENWDGVSPVNFSYHLRSGGAVSVDEYGMLAHSLLNGRLDLIEEPPAALLALENPYDTDARNAAAPESLWDAAYYNGRYYVYFGVVPCLLFQLPFEAITGIQGLPHCFGMIVMAWLMLLAVFGMVKQALRRWFPQASVAAYLLGCCGIVAGSGLYYLLLRPWIYENAVLSGMAFTCLALWQWLCAANAPPQKPAVLRLHLALGSLCMALVAGCRPQMELFVLAAVPLFLLPYLRSGRLFTKAGVLDVLCFVLPFIPVAAGLMWYNAARFGSPFDFGATYNLTTNDMTARGFKAGWAGTGVFAFFASAPALQAVFPHISDVTIYTNLLGTNITEEFYGGLIFACPVVLGYAMLYTLRRPLRRAGGGVWGLVCLLPPLAVVLAALDSVMAGVLYRYLSDFAAPLLFGAVLVWLCAGQALATHSTEHPLAPRLQRAYRTVWGLCTAVAVLFQFNLFFYAWPNLYVMAPAMYQSMVRTLQFWL